MREIGQPFSIDVLFKMGHEAQTANLPRSNPTVTSVDVVQSDTVIRLNPTVTHASPGGQVTRLAWRVMASTGAVRSYGLTEVGAAATHVEIPRSVLGTGTFVARVIVRDAQGPSSAARSATFTVAPGQLVVTINGLPTGVNANTLVAGPDGYSQPITNSTTLTLPPSTYTITANNVRTGGTTYTPTPTSQQRTVTSNTSTGATIAYAHAIAVTFSPTSASLSPGGTQSFTATVTGTTNTAVTWTLTPNCGTLAGSGNTRTYTAPATGPATCTLTATSNADTSRSASASIDVSAGNRPPTIDEVWLRYQSGERFECGSIIPQEYIGFYWRSSDPDGDTVTHQYRVDDGSWHDRSGTSVNLWLDDRPPGTLRTLRVRAIDSHGNVSAASSCTARVSVPPEIIDYAGPTDALGYRAGETAAFAVDVRDADGHYPSEVILMLRRDGANVATIQMALQFDHGPANKLTYVTTYRFTVAGSYDYLIWVTDALGVMANATDRVAFTIHP